jgi:hypothetical protein
VSKHQQQQQQQQPQQQHSSTTTTTTAQQASSVLFKPPPTLSILQHAANQRQQYTALPSTVSASYSKPSNTNMDLSAYFSNQPPSMMHGAALAPTLAGGQIAADAPIILAQTMLLLKQQEQRFGQGQQPPVLVQQQQQQQQPYSGPPLRYLMTGRQVKFCCNKEEVLHHYQTVPQEKYWPVPEYAAKLQGPNAAGVVRARINTTGV